MSMFSKDMVLDLKDIVNIKADLKILCEKDYELKKVTVVDQFGHTTHTETVCLLGQVSC